MAVVAGRVRVNRPYFFTDTQGGRAEFPAFGIGIGELEGAALREFNVYVDAKQIEGLEVQAPDAFTSGMWSVTGGAGEFTVTINAIPSGHGAPVTDIAVMSGSIVIAIIDAEIGSHVIPRGTAGTLSIRLVAASIMGDSELSDTKSVTVT